MGWQCPECTHPISRSKDNCMTGQSSNACGPYRVIGGCQAYKHADKGLVEVGKTLISGGVIKQQIPHLSKHQYQNEDEKQQCNIVLGAVVAHTEVISYVVSICACQHTTTRLYLKNKALTSLRTVVYFSTTKNARNNCAGSRTYVIVERCSVG